LETLSAVMMEKECMCWFKWFIQFHGSAKVTKKKKNKICFITSQGEKRLSERKQELMKPRREVCERMQLD
jgi:hypothetical protein